MGKLVTEAKKTTDDMIKKSVADVKKTKTSVAQIKKEMGNAVTEVSKQANEQVKQILNKAEGQVGKQIDAVKKVIEADKANARQKAIEEAKTRTKLILGKAKAVLKTAAQAHALALSDSKVTDGKIRAAEAALTKINGGGGSSP